MQFHQVLVTDSIYNISQSQIRFQNEDQMFVNMKRMGVFSDPRVDTIACQNAEKVLGNQLLRLDPTSDIVQHKQTPRNHNHTKVCDANQQHVYIRKSAMLSKTVTRIQK
jgi:hypothetical protein